MRKIAIPIILLISIGCATHQVKTMAIVSRESAKAVQKVQENVKLLHDSGSISDVDYQVWKDAFIKMSDVGLQLNQALREGNEQNAATQINAALGLLDYLIANGIPKLPTDKQVIVLILIESARGIFVAIAAGGQQ